MSLTTLTPAEFSAAKASGERFIRDRSDFILDDVDYVEVVTAPFADARGCLAHPRSVLYRRA